jgi:hypothetical protein
MGRFSALWSAQVLPPICRDVGSLSVVLGEPSALATPAAKADMLHKADLVGAGRPNVKIFIAHNNTPICWSRSNG